MVVVDINLDVKYTKEREPVLDLGLFKEAVRTLEMCIRDSSYTVQ